MKRPDLVKLAKQIGDVDQTAKHFYSDEIFALNLNAQLFKIYEAYVKGYDSLTEQIEAARAENKEIKKKMLSLPIKNSKEYEEMRPIYKKSSKNLYRLFSLEAILKKTNGDPKKHTRNEMARLLFMLFSYADKKGVKEYKFAEDYPNARLGIYAMVKDMSSCLTTAYDIKIPHTFARDVIGYLLTYCEHEGIDIFAYLHRFIKLQLYNEEIT